MYLSFFIYWCIYFPSTKRLYIKQSQLNLVTLKQGWTNLPKL